MKGTHPSRTVALAALLAVTATTALADTVFTYQGRLNEDGGPASGAYDMRFRLFDAVSGGSQVGPLVLANDVPVSDGLFTAEIDLGMGVFDGDPRWLQVEVFAPDNQVWRVLSPRQPLTAVPYAMYAFGGPGGGGGFWSANGDHIYNNNSGSVGVGTTTPEYALDVRSDGLRAIFGQASAATGITQGVYGEAVSRQGTGVWGISMATSGIAPGVRGETSSTEGYAVWGLASATSGGNVGGLFQSSSTGGRGVIGSVLASSGVNYGVFGQTNSPDGFAGYFIGGKSHFGGNIGIRTTEPTAILDINGEGSGDHSLRLNHPGASTGQMLFTSPAGSPGLVGVANNTNRRDIRFSDLGLFLIANNSPDTPPATHGVFIEETGRVGIGTTSPDADARLTVSANGQFNAIHAASGAAAWPTIYGFNGNTLGHVLHADGIADVKPAQGGVVIVGQTDGENLAIDGNEIMARDNGEVSTLHLNLEGGHIVTGGRLGVGVNPGFAQLAVHDTDPGAAFGLEVETTQQSALPSIYASNLAGGPVIWALGSSDVEPEGGGLIVVGDETGGNIAIDHNEIMARDGGQVATLYLNNQGGDVRIGQNGGNSTVYVPVLAITGADLAEKFPVASLEGVTPGTVMEIDPDNVGKLRVSHGAYNRRVAGVVSGAGDIPVGAILGNLPGHEDAPAIALSGRVWVRCQASHEAIEPGDMLTTADGPGLAMKASDLTAAQGATIGKAMTRLAKGESGLVLVLVNLQ